MDKEKLKTTIDFIKSEIESKQVCQCNIDGKCERCLRFEAFLIYQENYGIDGIAWVLCKTQDADGKSHMIHKTTNLVFTADATFVIGAWKNNSVVELQDLDVQKAEWWNFSIDVSKNKPTEKEIIDVSDEDSEPSNMDIVEDILKELLSEDDLPWEDDEEELEPLYEVESEDD